MRKQLRFKGGPESALLSSNTNSREAGESGAESNSSSFDLFVFLHMMFLNRRWLIGSVLIAGIVTAVATLFSPNQYTSTATLLPSSSGGGLSALKGITGLSVLDMAGGFGGSSESSSELFPTTLNSARLRNTILRQSFQFTQDGQQHAMTMQEYLGEDNLDMARKGLAKITAVGSEFKTGVITLSVTTKHPELSALVAQAYIDELDNFNRTQRKTRATEYEEFLRTRLEVSKVEMSASEDALEAVQTLNRDWLLSNDPALQKDLLIRKRDLTIKTKTFALLTQQYEIAKSETRKDLPVVQALDTPAIPLIKSAPQRSMTVVFAMLIAGVFGIGFMIIRESFQRRNDESEDSSLSQLRNDVNKAYPRLSGSILRQASQKEEHISV